MSVGLLQAMAREEGWYGPATDRPRRNNNPLDLTYCAETVEAGALRGDPRFAVFSSPAVGWRAAGRWLAVPARFDGAGALIGGYAGASLADVINRFSPPFENDTSAYLANVCAWTGFTPQTVVTEEIIANGLESALAEG